MKIDLTDRQLRDINCAILIYLHKLEVDVKENNTEMCYDEHPLIQSYLKIYDYIEDIRKKKNKLKKTESDPFDPYKRKYYASKGFYQQLTAADMMGLKPEASLVKYRKNGVLKENIHWIRTIGRGISYKPEACKLAIRKAKLGY